MADSTAAKAAVLGDPVAHSLSPILHTAGYEALSLVAWSYEAIRCPEGALAGIVGSAEDEYRGFSVTMPGKPEALAFADKVTERARLVDSANTLVRTGAGWLADCTDIDGAFAALSAHEDLPPSPTIVLLGAGGTARPFIAAIARIPGASIIIATRRPTAGGALECAARFGVEARDVRLTDPELPALIESTDLVVNTIPETGALELTELVRPAARLVDATLRAFRSTRVVSAMGNPEIARLLLRDSAALAGVRHPVGVRSDSLGTYPVIPTWAENQWSQYVVERDPIVALLSRRYRTAPVLTEWPPQMLTGGTVLDYYRRAVSQVVDGHVSMTSSTGFPAQSRPERMTSEQYDLWSRATKYAGYRYAVTAAGLAPASDRDPATLTIRWANFGSAPTYDRWTTTYEFVDGEGRSVASVPAGVDLSTLFASPTVPYEDTAASPPVAETTDTVAVPLLPGAYVLWVKVAWSEHKLDATHRMELPPMNLALRGRDCDGAYTVGKIDVR
mgnify:CR=1 FL=1